VAFGLRRRGIKDVDSAVMSMLELVELAPLARRKPAQLSGGQQQRVAVARALINRPDVLLLDEPLGALDLKLRRQMQIELKRIQTDVGTTFVHVTHDQEEAMTMADTVAVMNSGRIEQLGHPADIYELPRTAFVANFLGQANLIEAQISTSSGDIVASAHGVTFSLPADRSFAKQNDIIVGVRPEKLTVLDHFNAHLVPDGHNRVTGRVTDVSYAGVSTQYVVRTPWGQDFIAFEQNMVVGDRCDRGDEVVLHWSPSHTFGLDGTQDVNDGIASVVLEEAQAASALGGE